MDIETTGLEEDSRIVSVGACKTSNLESFFSLVEPGQDILIPEESIAIHGITREILDREAPPEIPEVAERLAEFCEDLPILAHNASFDHSILENNLLRTQQEDLLETLCNPERWHDTLALSREWHTGRHSLEALAKRLNVNLGQRAQGEKIHTADEDARILAECWNVWQNPKFLEKQNIFNLENIENDENDENKDLKIPENLKILKLTPEQQQNYSQWVNSGSWKSEI